MSDRPESSASLSSRYNRQMLLPQIGVAGQAKIERAVVLLVGCGALGTVIADQLVRAGVGTLRLVDRDIVEPSNLQRQTLFDESDAQRGEPKAMAAAKRLAQVNSNVSIEPHILDVNTANIETLAKGVDLILDGTDNVAVRYLINDVAVKHGIPWVYGAAVGTQGRMLAVDPGHTPCLRCLFPVPPDAGLLATCDTAGVLGAVPMVIGALQAAAALKILTGQGHDAYGWLYSLDVWTNRMHTTDARESCDTDCICCGQHVFEWLDRPVAPYATSLCGRNAVQVLPSHAGKIDFAHLEQRLAGVGAVTRTAYLVRCTLHDEPVTISIFHDGRAIVQGVNDPGRARSIYARYIGE